jgi:DNA-binding transcriptional LysR family regulator
MDLNALEAFVAVAESSSFSRAAEQLFLTQPAVSKRIATLESQLDARLFDRVGRSIQLTEAGAALLPTARRVLAELQQTRTTLKQLASGEVAGRLSIGTSHHIGLHRLPPVLRSFTADYPSVELDLHFMDSEEACAAVERSELELAVVTLPESPFPRLATEEIWPDPLDFVVGPEHPLAGKPRVRFEQLVRHPAIVPARGTVTRDILDQALLPRGLRLKVALETNYLETIKMMVSVGLGWSMLPKNMLGEEVIALSCEGKPLMRRLGLARLRGRSLSNAADAFIGTLQTQRAD